MFLAIHGFEIRVKFGIFFILVCKKRNKTFFGVIEYICEYFLGIVECKFARNGFNN